MILYLSSSQNTNLLDFHQWQSAETQLMPIKKMVGSFTLKKFVVYDMRNFSHITEIVLDRIAFIDTDNEFVEAVQEFLTMYEIRITVIYEGLSAEQELYQGLLACKVGNLVCGETTEEIRQELTECLSEQGMEHYLKPDRQVEKSERYQFHCRNVRIAIVSSQQRTGATTTACGLCSWLSMVGARVAYVEKNESGHLAWLAKSYGMEETAQGYMADGIYYGSDSWEGNANFVVYDIGEYQDAKRDVILDADLQIFVCGSKPYELRRTMYLKKQFLEQQAWILCPFAGAGIELDIRELLEGEYHQVLFPEYQPEIMDGTANRMIYKNMITKYIAGA
ncbi:MAG: hypothetical protein ACRDBO_04110 [Lachnospiraceae bacterium]